MFLAITSHPILLAMILASTNTVNAQDHGVKVPPGFKVTLYADHTLANDIYCMTLDDEGRVIVSSRGWVRRLRDTDGDGRADKAEVMFQTATGGMGLSWSDSASLYFCGDGWLSRWYVGRTTSPWLKEEPVDKLLRLRFGEHGGHAMRKGPDGCWYVIAGNDAELAKVKLDPSSPIKNPEAGGILRFSKDMKKVECIAHGFRNPYDFDFTPLGDIITYDSDTERDFLLPWYSPTRMYHVAHGQHHGWRLPGYMQSLARRDYYPDTVDILSPIGRGSPTGVVCYRHYQYPKRYHGGVFALDWTFGKIWFVPLEADGSTYKTKPEVFLEPIGSNGFAPTDACVAPDGSLFVSIGGRGTRGAVYRIEYVGTKEEPRSEWKEPEKDLDKMFAAPQPLDAWSRAQWEPLARKFSTGVILEEALKTASVTRSIRAIEIVTDLGEGPIDPWIKELAQSKSWQVRARVAWSLGRVRIKRLEGSKADVEVLRQLAQDNHLKVRANALDALGDRIAAATVSGEEQHGLVAILSDNLAHPDKRVRLAASRVVTLLVADCWLKVHAMVSKSNVRAQLAFALSDHLHEISPTVFASDKKRTALAGLRSNDHELRLNALRLLMLIDGDWCLHNPPQVVYSAYALQTPRKEVSPSDKDVRSELRRMYPTGDPNFDHEAARYFAMIEDDDPATVGKILARITKDTTARDDVHHLIVLARLKGQREPSQTSSVVDALFSLEKKWQGYQQKIKQNWAARLLEVVVDLARKHPDLPDAMLKHPAFVHPSHVVFTITFNAEQRKQAARSFVEAVKKDGDFLWSPELIDLLAALPPAEHRPLFRKQWSDYSLRDAMLKHLVIDPETEDRKRFLDGLDSPQREMVVACLAALEKLPKSPTAANLAPVLRRLRSSLQDPKEKDVRDKILAYLRREVGPLFSINEDTKDPARLRELFAPVFTWFDKNHPAEAKLLRGDAEDAEHWQKQLAVAPWSKGDVARGAKLFQQRSCAACHTGSSRIGADLTGTASRFSRDDLFTAILYPSRDVAPAFRVNEIDTQDGKHFSGIVVFESADGVIVQLDAVNTVRIDSGNIASRQPGRKSLMPNGLLKDLKPEDLADLYAYLQSLKSGP
jgi:putative heme-binding domain-containing protein